MNKRILIVLGLCGVLGVGNVSAAALLRAAAAGGNAARAFRQSAQKLNKAVSQQLAGAQVRMQALPDTVRQGVQQLNMSAGNQVARVLETAPGRLQALRANLPTSFQQLRSGFSNAMRSQNGQAAAMVVLPAIGVAGLGTGAYLLGKEQQQARAQEEFLAKERAALYLDSLARELKEEEYIAKILAGFEVIDLEKQALEKMQVDYDIEMERKADLERKIAAAKARNDERIAAYRLARMPWSEYLYTKGSDAINGVRSYLPSMPSIPSMSSVRDTVGSYVPSMPSMSSVGDTIGSYVPSMPSVPSMSSVGDAITGYVPSMPSSDTINKRVNDAYNTVYQFFASPGPTYDPETGRLLPASY